VAWLDGLAVKWRGTPKWAVASVELGSGLPKEATAAKANVPAQSADPMPSNNPKSRAAKKG
jgi:hypothetical protein